MALANLTTASAHQAMVDGLVGRIRAEMRERILEAIEPALEASITASVEALRIGVETMLHPHSMGMTIGGLPISRHCGRRAARHTLRSRRQGHRRLCRR